MKKYFSITTISFLYVLLSVFVKPGVVSATSYSTGSLIKLANKATIYYVASDNLKYAIPDEVTYKSWYDNFSTVKTVSNKDFNSFRTAKSVVTVKPIKNLVKFSNSNQVYVVDSGATLRWLVNENVAKMYFGADWSKKIITLPSSNLSNYIVGTSVDGVNIFSKTRASSMSGTIDDELRNRNIIANSNTSYSVAGTTELEPLLRSMKENLRASLQPGFNSRVNNYFITADFTDTSFTLTPLATDTDLQVFVNGVSVDIYKSINLALAIGENNFTIRVVNQQSTENVYTLQVLREKANDNYYIRTMTENLRDNLDPSFNTSVFDYSLKAEYDENVLNLRILAEDTLETVYVNEQKLSGSHTGTASILLKYGENKVTIRVVAENGANKYYNLTVTRYQYPKLGANDLSYLKTNFSSRIYPVFDPKTSVYYLRVTEDESRITISAKAINNKAHVIIDGSNVSSKSITIPYGESVITVSVELVDAPEFTKTYKIRVYRGDEPGYRFE